MDHSIFISSIIYYVESHIKQEITYDGLEKEIGISYHHMRQQFKDHTGVSLKQYINHRRITNAAFEILHTNKGYTEIANEYHFDVYDTFTRAFKRVSGVTPKQFKETNMKMKIGHIALGMYAPIFEKEYIKVNDDEKMDYGFALFGLPKIEYASGRCVPFANCLSQVLAYRNHPYQHDYAYIMGATQAAFRLRWNEKDWDLSSSEIRNINVNHPDQPMIRSLEAVGCNYTLLRKENTDKEAFKQAIIKSLKQGNPVIGFGIVGPPEACLIAGYQEEGEVLLGWSYFQDDPELTKGVHFMSNGYFQTSQWWENPYTIQILIIEDTYTPKVSIKEMLLNIYEVMTMKETGQYLCGIRAYDGWIHSLKNEAFFASNAITPFLLNSVFCQADAETMLGEGRYWASEFFKDIANKYDSITKEAEKLSSLFLEIAHVGQTMTKIRDGYIVDENMIEKFCLTETRKELIQLLEQAKQKELLVIKKLNELIQKF